MPYKEDISGVYCLKAIDCGLIYIGSSKGIKHRYSTHKYAIRKGDTKRYVKEFINCKDIQCEILEVTDNLFEREQYWIEFYKNQNVWKLVNVFDADREGSSVPDSFRNKMSLIRKEKWKDEEYRKSRLENLKRTQFSTERLNKKVHFYKNGIYMGYAPSAKILGQILNLPKNIVANCARGAYRNKFKYKDYIFIYDEKRVLYKLDELLEAHQELRVISSQAWEASFEYHEGSETNS